MDRRRRRRVRRFSRPVFRDAAGVDGEIRALRLIDGDARALRAFRKSLPCQASLPFGH